VLALQRKTWTSAQSQGLTLRGGYGTVVAWIFGSRIDGCGIEWHMRKSTFRKISIVFLVCALGVLMAHRIHRVVARHTRTCHAHASQPRNMDRVVPDAPVSGPAAAPFDDQPVRQRSGLVCTGLVNFLPGPTHTNADRGIANGSNPARKE
jgi:hypothetical protein